VGISFGILSIAGLLAWFAFALILALRSASPEARRAGWAHVASVLLFAMYLFAPRFFSQEPQFGPGEMPVDPMLAKDIAFLIFLAAQVLAMGLTWKARPAA